MDEASKSALRNNVLNMHSSKPLFETQSQGTLKRQRSDMVSANPLAAALKDQSAPSKEAYENFGERSAKSRVQSSTELLAGSGAQDSAPHRPYNPGRDPRAWPGQAGLGGLALAPSGLGKRDAGDKKK
jgi:hypothetical protein